MKFVGSSEVQVKSSVFYKGVIAIFFSHEYLKYNLGTLKAMVGSIKFPLIEQVPIGLDFLSFPY